MVESRSLLAGIPVATPGIGLGWTKVAAALEKIVVPVNVRRVWIFPPLKRDGREWGTAVIATAAEHGRLIVVTARYMLNTRGRSRGQGKVEVEEVGEGPVEVVPQVVRGVHDRVSEGEPAIEISPELWFSRDHDEPTTQT